MAKVQNSSSHIFKNPEPELYNSIVELFEAAYSLEELLIMKRCSKPFFIIHLSQTGIEQPLDQAIDFYYSLRAPKNKRCYAELLALIFSDPRNFHIYMNWLPKNAQQIWKDIVINNGISSKKMINEYNVYFPGLGTPSFEMTRETVTIFCFFSFYTYYISSQYFDKKEMYFFYLPSAIRSYMLSHFLPAEKYNFSTIKELPAEEGLLIYENKQEILSNIPYITGLQQQGYMSLGIKGNVTVSTVNLITRRMEFSEFYTSIIKEAANLRAWLVLNIINKFDFTSQKAGTVDVSLRELFLKYLPMDFGWLLPLLLGHVKGIRELNKLENPGAEEYLMVIQLLENLHGNEWMSVENMMHHSHYIHADLCPLPYDYMTRVGLKFRNETIYDDSYYEIITLPFVKSVLFLFASFGIIDIAHEEYSLGHDTYFESIKYFRLTELGEYILGRKNNYNKGVQTEEEHYFEADDTNLIIRSIEPNNKYEKLLAEMSVPIGTSRFKVTHTSLLRPCKTPEDIENKINFFHRFVCAEPPQIWKEFFNSIKQRANPLEEVTEEYRLFKLDSSNTDLIRLIAQDPQIKKYALKVENHYLLIKTSETNKVIERLKTYGYLL